MNSAPQLDAPAAAAVPNAGAREPPAWLGPAALAFWGLHTGLWWLALPLALLAALPGWRGWRFELEVKERRRVADLCTVMITLAGAWLVLNQPRLGSALILLIQWLPGLLFPLLAVQLYGRRPGLELSVLFMSLRGEHRPGSEVLFDLRWAYVLICIIAAAMIPPQTPWLLPSLALLAAAALLPWAPAAQGRRGLFAVLLVLALATSLALAAGLRWGHVEAERAVLRWMEQWLGPSLDPYRATTAIGEVGRLKGSERILLRVYPDAPLDDALLLRTASYDRYVNGTWFTTGSLFEPVPDHGGRRPLLGPAAGTGTGEQRIVMLLRRTEGLLPLPPDAAVISGMPERELHRNDYGTVRYTAAITEPLLNYRVRPAAAAAAHALTAPPTAADLRVVGQDAAAIAALADELGLAKVSPEQALTRLERFFLRDFRYTLTLPEPPADTGPLAHFLAKARAGHCEYFATAAALLLRSAGVPSRYARGWSVQEYSPLEDAWIARDSHTHAWVQVYLDGRWQDFDPTPPDWAALEAAERPWTQDIGDFFAWLRLALSGAAAEDRADRNWLLLPLAVLVVILAWRIIRRAQRGERRGRRAPARTGAEDSSAFTELERIAARHGHGRREGETLLEWARRLHAEGVHTAAALTEAVQLHYRSRFDPAGLAPDAHRRLRHLLGICARRWSSAAATGRPV
jgi:hypothetical protein